MSKISEIDKNFAVQSTNDREDTVYFKATDPRFEVNGVFYEDGKFRRLPEAVAKETSWGVLGLSVHTAGGRLRFKTNSKYIILKATLSDVGKMPHFALTGSAGFDLYKKGENGQEYVKTFVPAFDITELLGAVPSMEKVNHVCDLLREKEVELRGCAETLKILPGILPASEADWDTEYLGPVLSIRIVHGIEEAMKHIALHGSGHTDGIITNSLVLSDKFIAGVDSASGLVNASTRLSGGGDYGLGAVVGISTDRLHARGPVGPAELCTYKWIAIGNGQLRD